MWISLWKAAADVEKQILTAIYGYHNGATGFYAEHEKPLKTRGAAKIGNVSRLMADTGSE
jgi:hypothetical protein